MTATKSEYTYLGEHGAVQFQSGPYRGTVDYIWTDRNFNDHRISVQAHDWTEYERSISKGEQPPIGTITCLEHVPTEIVGAICADLKIV